MTRDLFALLLLMLLLMLLCWTNRLKMYEMGLYFMYGSYNLIGSLPVPLSFKRAFCALSLCYLCVIFVLSLR